MKRKSLLLLLLMAVFAPWAAQAQEIVEIGNGTATGYYVPFNTLYGYSFTETVYLANSIAIDGETVAGIITSVSFHLGRAATNGDQTNEYDIYMKHVTRETFASITDFETITTDDLVFSGTWTIPQNYTGWLTITLDTPFEYDGESNLMVAIHEKTSGYSTRYFTYTSVTRCTIQAYHDSKNPDPFDMGSYSGTKATHNNLPNTRFEIIPGGSICHKPSEIWIGETSATFASINWSGGSGTSNVQYKKASDQEWIDRVTNYGPEYYGIGFPDLDPATTYNARVQSVCDGGLTSGWRNISFTTADPCATPTNLQITDITAESATLTWTPGYQETTWTVKYKKSTETEYTEETVNGTPTITLNGLSSGATYNVQVYNCENYVSDNFTTVCGAITVTYEAPYIEDFDSYTTDATSTSIPSNYPNDELPLCWSFLNRSNGGTYPQVFLSSYSSYAVSGNCLFFKSSGNESLYAILPEFGNAISDLQLSFTYRNEGTDDRNGTLYVGYMTDPSDANTFETVYTCERTTTKTFVENIFFTNAPEGSYIAFNYAGGSSNNYYLAIDNVVVEAVPACIKPTGLTASDVTARTVTLSWQSGGDAWQIGYQKVDGEYLYPEQYIEVTENLYTLTGLDPETNYEIRVQTKCSEELYSIFTNPITITTGIACPAPDNLTISNLTATTATLTWTELGEGTSWLICLDGDEESLIEVNETTYTFPELQSEMIHTAKVKSNCGTAWSSVVEFEPTAKLVIGSGTATSYYLPTSTNFDYSYTQQIYTVEEFGEAGVIESIDFYMTSSSDYTRNLDVYMVSTDKESFTGTTDWIAVTAADLVFSGDVAFTAQSWTTITLDEAFLYDGTQNVAIIVDDNTGDWSGRYFRVFTTTAQQAIYKYQDNTNIPIDYSSNGTLLSSKNQIRIMKSPMGDCMKPTRFAVGEVGPNYVVLSWNENGISEDWVICYTDIANDVNYTQAVNASDLVNGTYTLQGLNSLTNYVANVIPACGVIGDQYNLTLFSNEVSFTTLEACPTPENVTVSNIMHYSADLAWTGYSDSYTVTLGQEGGLIELLNADFDNQTIPADWTNDTINPWVIAEHGEGYCLQSAIQGQANTTTAITAIVTYPVDGTISFDLLSKGEGSDGNDWDKSRFYIDGVRYIDYGAHSNWESFSTEVLAGTHTFTWEYKKDGTTNPSGDYFAIDNVVISYTSVVWETPVTIIGSTEYTAEGLTANTLYFVKVQGLCGETSSEESTVVSFTTLSENYKIFAVEGDWNNEYNWIPTGVPTIEQDVELRANVVIDTEGGAAEANSIAQGEYTITIYEGGQLKHNNAGVVATVEKMINGYDPTVPGGMWGDEPEPGLKSNDGKWYLISNPFSSSITPSENDLLSGDFDLYEWNAMASDALEWRNYKAESFTLLYGMNGYLYANKEDKTLLFTGTLNASQNAQAEYFYSASNTSGNEFAAWALLGNPFVCNGYLVDAYTNGAALPYYRMNAAGNGFEAVEDGAAIAPMEGVFYEVPSTTYVYITREAPASKSGNLNMVVSQGRGTVDNAIIRFGEGQQLSKMSFREGSSKVYIPVEGKDYAIANAEGTVGEMPVNFKAESNGTYSLSFTNKDVEFSYLHLIDNLTGNDVDLLETPSYSFEAKTTDYASRFHLVFATGSSVSNDSFSFINASGNLCIFGIEGKATVQVIDVMGHVLSSETFSGSYEKSINAAPGVYMIRLIQGNDVKVQKVVVK